MIETSLIINMATRCIQGLILILCLWKLWQLCTGTRITAADSSTVKEADTVSLKEFLWAVSYSYSQLGIVEYHRVETTQLQLGTLVPVFFYPDHVGKCIAPHAESCVVHIHSKGETQRGL